jgi:IstB-like ATP binding protein
VQGATRVGIALDGRAQLLRGRGEAREVELDVVGDLPPERAEKGGSVRSFVQPREERTSNVVHGYHGSGPVLRRMVVVPLEGNQSVTQWGTVFGDDVIAAAILDRLLHHSHTFMVQGESYRLRQKRKAGLHLHSTPPMDA